MPRKKKKKKIRKKRSPVPVCKYQSVNEFDQELKRSDSDLAMIYRFYQEVPDDLFLGAVMVVNMGGMPLVRDAMGGHLMAVIDSLLVRSLCSAGSGQVLFLLKLSRFQALTTDFLKTLEFRNQQIIKADGRREVYDKQNPKLVGSFIRVVFKYLERSPGDLFIICWRYLLLQHSYLTSKHPLSVSVFDSKSGCEAVTLRKRMRAMVAPTFEHAYHHKIDAFLAIRSLRSMPVLLNAIKHQLLGRFDQDELEAFLKVLERWPEGRAVAKKVIPRFNHLPFGFFDRSRSYSRSQRSVLVSLRLLPEAESEKKNSALPSPA